MYAILFPWMESIGMTSFLLNRSAPPAAMQALAEDAAPRLLLERLAHLQPEPLRLLSIDCGDGHLLRWGLRWFPGTPMSGTDQRPDCLDRAVKNARHARFLQADSRALPLPDRSFDMIALLASEMRDRDAWWLQLREMRRILADGGLLGVGGPVVSLPSDWLHSLGLTVVDMRYRPPSGGFDPVTVLVLRAYRREFSSL